MPKIFRDRKKSYFDTLGHHFKTLLHYEETQKFPPFNINMGVGRVFLVFHRQKWGPLTYHSPIPNVTFPQIFPFPAPAQFRRSGQVCSTKATVWILKWKSRAYVLLECVVNSNYCSTEISRVSRYVNPEMEASRTLKFLVLKQAYYSKFLQLCK